VTPGQRWAARLAALPPDQAVSRDGGGVPLDEQGTLLLLGPDADRLALELGALLAEVRAELDGIVVEAAQPRDGERVLPTSLGGAPAFARAVAAAAAAGAGLDDPYVVVALLAEAPTEPDRWLARTAGALLASVRRHDVVCRVDDGFVVLAPRCGTELGERLTEALLDVGVGAAAGVAVGVDPQQLLALARADAVRALSARQVWRL
jgi:hypothetical protein